MRRMACWSTLSLWAVAMILAGPAAAGSWEFTALGGWVFFDDSTRIEGARIPIEDNVYGGGRLGYQFHPRFGIQFGGGLSPTNVDPDDGGNIDFLHVHGDFMYSPIAGDWGDIHGLLGGGWARLETDSTEETSGTFDVGAGMRLWLGSVFGLRFEVRNILNLADNLEASRVNEVVASGGITLAFGRDTRDTDGDGVRDGRDKCPATPAGATVDARGCPADADGDGVFDGLDKCPGTLKGAAVDATGCPKDADGDNVPDGLDKCDGTPTGADVDASGCPADSDGDGVFDGIDKCANSPKGATVDATGCTKDSDGDGVLDGLDKCPGTAAGLKVDVEGCPIEVTERETELLDTGMIRLQDVNFEIGKADLQPESHATLDIVGAVLSKWPELRIEVGGHTDSRGSNAANQTLSEARANSVVTYLTGKFPGLKADQFTAKGYGESKPVAANNNALNMAKNRRVEFVVLNKDVLKREVERRRTLQKDGN